MSLRSYLLSLKLNGVLDTTRYIQLDLMNKRREYENSLRALFGKPQLQNDKIKLVQDDAEELTNIQNNSADILISKDVFEHLKHPERAAKRISQKLKKDGVCIHIIHLFTSISGGHNPEWSNFEKFEPWGHLRNVRFTLPYHLNRWRTQNL